ncbi:lipocalin family protein [Dyella sp. A6]|uniref:lipocalin family protein n=1 Tax=Dyella aluminiiresistens TaxID=3069105 RepID=UPI002E7A6E4A|nr:lipocalin family protein [Dyella sp. A6]
MRPRNERWEPTRPTTETVAAPTASQPIEAIARLSLEQLAGTWHEIAQLPGSFGLTHDGVAILQFERGGDQTLTLVRRPIENTTGKVRVRRCIMNRPKPGNEPAQFRLRSAPDWLAWLPSVWSDCWVIALDVKAGWAMLADPEKRSLCLLSREPRMQRELFDTLKGRVRHMGFDLAPLVVSPFRAG